MKNHQFPQTEPLEKDIQFYTEGLDFELESADKICTWISETIQEEGYNYNQISYIFCDDQYLHTINVDHLSHDTYTDIITFDYTDCTTTVSGDLFISIERVQENADILNIPFLRELYRVMIHGILHLCGYKDSSPEEEEIMRKQEDVYLDKFMRINLT